VDKFELISYNVESWKSELGVGEEKIADGFILQENVDQYRIYGKVKNLMNYEINVLITFNFYALNDFYLDSFTLTLNNITRKNETSFYQIFQKDDINHFANVNNVTIELKEGLESR
jgi:hypothetical protein